MCDFVIGIFSSSSAEMNQLSQGPVRITNPSLIFRQEFPYSLPQSVERPLLFLVEMVTVMLLFSELQ